MEYHPSSKGASSCKWPVATYLEFSHFHFHCVGRYPCNFGHELVLTLLKSNVVTHTDYDAITRQFARDLGLQEFVVCYQSIFNCIRTLYCNKMVPCSLHIGNSFRGVYGLDIVINQGSETYNETRQRSSQIRQFLVKVAISKVRLQLSHINFSQPLANLCQIRHFVKIVTFQEATFCHLI